MEPPNPTAATTSPATPRHLVLPTLLDAIDAWQAEPTARRQEDVAHALEGVARLMGLAVGRVRVHAPPLPELDIDLGGGTTGAEIALRVPGVAEPIGSARISGDPEQATAMAHALERGFLAARVAAQAERATNQLNALDQAVRGISGELDVDRSSSSSLIGSRPGPGPVAAIGILDATAHRELITSGISDEDRARIGDLPHGRGLLGLIIRENRAYRIPDIGSHSERYGFPPNHPEMQSFLGLPITIGGATVGRLYLTNKLGAAEFSETTRPWSRFRPPRRIAIRRPTPTSCRLQSLSSATDQSRLHTA